MGNPAETQIRFLRPGYPASARASEFSPVMVISIVLTVVLLLGLRAENGDAAEYTSCT